MNETSTPYLKVLCALAHIHGFRITATTNGRHNTGSLHYCGRAIDVSVRGKTPAQIGAFVHDCKLNGFFVRDERHRPLHQRIWGGPHLHIEDREGL